MNQSPKDNDTRKVVSDSDASKAYSSDTPQKTADSRYAALQTTTRMDLRLPFAICAVEGLLLLGIFTWLISQRDTTALWQYGLVFLAIYALTIGILFIAYANRFSKLQKAQQAAEMLNTDIYRMFRAVIDIPYAVVSTDGIVKVMNSALQNILGLRSALGNIPLREICPNITPEQIAASTRHSSISPDQMPSILPALSAHTGDVVVQLSDGKRYRLDNYLLHQHNETYYFLVFHDVNDYLEFMEKTDREHTVMAYIVLDNLQELTQFVRANYRATANEIENTLTRWVSGMNGMIREYDRDKYLALFSGEALEGCIRDEFPILNEIMSIRVGDNTFPVSVSMGIADISGTMGELEQAANNALQMALQRGGNQVALMRRGNTAPVYYGGTHKTKESNTSITSRVSVNLMEKELTSCREVLIMGHSHPDFDSIGSAVGAYRLCRSILDAQSRSAVPVHIVVDMECDTFRTCYKQLRHVPEYEDVFVNRDIARKLVSSETVLIITDVNNPRIFEAPALINAIGTDPTTKVARIAVIDHHRLVNELPFVPFLHYIEATKSSASEIMAEMLEQSPYRSTLLKEEANMLLAGIMLDTHNFTRSTGAQTFDVTHYLYSCNAHTDVVREFFNETRDEIAIATEFNSHLDVYADVVAITWLSKNHVPSPDDRIAASKAADKLLELRGIEASFALAVIDRTVVISGRSKGRINVQLILEQLEGGGHFDMAGTQLQNITIKDAYDLLCAAIDDYKLQHPDQFQPAED